MNLNGYTKHTMLNRKFAKLKLKKIFFLVTLYSLQDLSSLTKDGTWTLGSESTES